MAGVKDYFSFSKRERTGAIVLIILIVVVFLLPEFYPVPKVFMDANSVALKKQSAEWKGINSDSSSRVRETGSDERNTIHYEPSDDYQKKASLFYFDPNMISEDGWKKLGISDRTVKTIKTYISKGGSFRKAEDIGKIYGLRPGQFEQLLPFVRIEKRNDPKPEKPHEGRIPHYNNADEIRTLSIIDINAADTSMLIALPGIGSKLANRIVSFRSKLGGFYSVDQVREIYGLQDSIFQKIKSFLQCNSSAIQKINVNTADAAALKNHPYIKWNIASAIVNYRSQHGEYKSVEDLLKIDILSTEILQKISPYLAVN